MTAAGRPKLSYAEYVAREQASELRHEFIDGEIFAMAGGTPEHAALIAAVTGVLFGQLRGGPCRAFVTEVRTRIRADAKGPDVGIYPDIAIVCGSVVRDSEDSRSSTPHRDRRSPVEFDRGVRPARQVRSLERFARADGGWSPAVVVGPAGAVELASVNARLDVDEVFRGLVGEDGRVRVC